jgi:hypothetical protein
MAQPARKYDRFDNEVANANWPYAEGNYDVASASDGSYQGMIHISAAGITNQTLNWTDISGNTSQVIVGWDGTTLSWSAGEVNYSGSYVNNSSPVELKSQNYIIMYNGNSAWPSGYPTGQYTTTVNGHANADGAIYLAMDGAGNLCCIGKWTPGNSSNGNPVTVTWNGTNLGWSTASNGSFLPGTLASSSPYSFSGAWSTGGPGAGGPGTWTATQGG